MARSVQKTIITILSATYLSALTVLAALALYKATYFALPMPQTLPALVVALPLLTGILYEIVASLQRKLGLRAGGSRGILQRSTPFLIVTAALLVCEAVLATLAGTRFGPMGNLLCPLSDRWRTMNSHKDTRIRQIQDAFDCCGFLSTRDMPWPFADRDHNASSCVKLTKRSRACMEPWMRVEREVAGMMLVVLVGMFVWKVVMILIPDVDVPWFQSAVRLPEGDVLDGPDSRQPRVIEYRDEEEDHAGDNSIRGEVGRLNQDAGHAARAEDGGRVYASGLRQ